MGSKHSHGEFLLKLERIFITCLLFGFILIFSAPFSRAQASVVWSPRQKLSNVPDGGLVTPINLLRDSTGTLHALWIQYNSGGQDGTYYAQKPANQPWGSPERVPLPFRGDNGVVEAVVATDGTIHLVAGGPCCGTGHALVYFSRSPSGIWSDLELISESYQIVGGPAITLGGDGRLHVTYTGAPLGSFEPRQLVYQFRSLEGGWSQRQVAALGTGNGLGSDLAIDAVGTLRVVWAQDFEGDILTQNYDVFSSDLPVGGQWSSPVKVSENAALVLRGYVLDQSSNAHLVFYDIALGQKLVYSTRSASGQWSSPVEVATTAFHPSLASSSDGILHLVIDNELGSVVYFQKAQGGQWIQDSVPATYSTQRGFVSPQLQLDGQDRLHLLFGDGDVYYITQENQPPVANAGADQKVVVNNHVTLDGSGSFDPDNDPISHLWGEEISNPQLNILSSTNIINPSLTPSVAGVYTFTLVVHDGLVSSAPDTVIITVQTPSEAIQTLIDLVEEFNLQRGIENSLEAKLENAIQALSDINENNDIAAINSLESFINEVEAQRGRKITDEQADELVSRAQEIIANLSVS